MKKLFFIIILLATFVFAQQDIEEDVERATINAKKGIYWSLQNIPAKKVRTDHELVTQNKVTAAVKIIKEVGGIKFESTGYHEHTTAKVTVYRSYDWLIQHKFIKNAPTSLELQLSD